MEEVKQNGCNNDTMFETCQIRNEDNEHFDKILNIYKRKHSKKPLPHKI